MPAHKIAVGKLITSLIDDAKKIEASDSAQKTKTQSFQRLATKFINQIYGDARKKESSKITPETARRYLTRARTALREFSGIHHRFNSEVERMSKKYVCHFNILQTLLGLPPSEARTQKIILKESLLSAKEILTAVERFDFSKSNVNERIKKLAEKHPLYRPEILGLSAGDTFAAKKRLIKTMREAQSLYDEVVVLKVDHELIVNLSMDTLDKNAMARRSKNKLAVKKNTKVHVDYPRYMNQVVEILQRKPESFYGDVKNIAPLVFALCAATGRRPVEILLTGNLSAKTKSTLMFTGQAKKREGDDDVERLIYSLVDSKIIETAFIALRSSPTVKSLVSGEAKEDDYRDNNSRLSGKISPHLSEFTKNFFIDSRRVFKDTRGIYGAICYQRFYLSDPRWKNKDVTVFFTELFGHADKDSQSNYMPYQLSNFTVDYQPNTAGVNERWERLCELDDDMPSLARLDAAVQLHNTVKDLVLENQAIKLTLNFLAVKTRKFKGMIKNYLVAIDDLALPDEPLTTQSNEGELEELQPNTSEPTVKKEHVEEKKPTEKADKPHINAKLLNNDLWEVIVKLGNKTQMFTLKTNSKITAMKIGYALFVGDLFEFKVTIPYKTPPHFQDTLYAKNEKEAERIALNDAGLDGFRGPYGKIEVKKL